jgi:hypothetical protein
MHLVRANHKNLIWQHIRMDVLIHPGVENVTGLNTYLHEADRGDYDDVTPEEAISIEGETVDSCSKISSPHIWQHLNTNKNLVHLQSTPVF